MGSALNGEKLYCDADNIYMAHEHCLYHGQNLLLTVETEIKLTFDS